MANQTDGSGCKPAVDPQPLVTVRCTFHARNAVSRRLSLDRFAAEHSSPHLMPCRISQWQAEDHASQVRGPRCQQDSSLFHYQKLNRDEPENEGCGGQCLLAKRSAGHAKIELPSVCQRVRYERRARHGEKK